MSQHSINRGLHGSAGGNGNAHRFPHQIQNIFAKGRRHSAAAIAAIRTGALPSWAGGPPASVLNHNSSTPTIEEEEQEFGFPMVEDLTESAEGEGENGHDDDLKSVKTRPSLHVHIQMNQQPIKDRQLSRVQGNVDLGLILSAMYAKLLIVMGIAFPLSEVMSTYIAPKYYDGFYIYLYVMSIIFMIYILGNVVKQKAKRSARGFIERVHIIKTKLGSSSDSGVAPDVGPDVVVSDGHEAHSDSDSGGDSTYPRSIRSCSSGRKKSKSPLEKVDSGSSMVETHHDRGSHRITNFGSFYLRMGAMAFGIGSMIYSGLEFGQYFELEKDTKCHNYMIALTPAVRMVFTFMQMYFIFLNSKMAFGKTSFGVSFGLMHMIGTNLCVWLNVLVEETRHEILHFYDPTNQTVLLHRAHDHRDSGHSYGHHHQQHHNDQNGDDEETNGTLASAAADFGKQVVDAVMNGGDDDGEDSVLHRAKRGLKGMYECRRSNIMGSLVDSASPFLFPCTIEYSLICAAICYVMWKSNAKRRAALYRRHLQEDGAGELCRKKSPHHYTVDCSRANKGLFLGIFFLVLTIMSLIINFVLVSRPGYSELAMLEVNITEIVIYTTTTLAVLLGMCQVRELQIQKGRNLELDNILLIVAQSGSFIYNVFSIIGGQFTGLAANKLVLLTPLASLIQLLLQTLFIIDASKRTPATAEQAKRKPGREVVTFLLVTNLAMWLINTLENSRGDSHPVQLQFYGIWAWTIITDISMPLAIFYRFHSTVCLCEIWKKAYKMKTVH